MEQPERHTSRFSLGGLILVFLGVVFLLQTLGVVPWEVWGTLWRFWPVALILVGINILWGRRSPWLVLAVSGVVLLGVIGAAVWIQESPPPLEATTSYSQPLQGVERAEVEIDFGAGELVIASLPTTSPNLVEGEGRPEVEQDFQLRDGTGVLHLSAPGRRVQWPFREGGFRLEAALNPNIPLELTLKAGASNARVDLTDLKVTRLRIDMGASRLNLHLPAGAGATEAVVKVGAADVTITIPQGVAARIAASTGLTSFNVDTSRFPKTGETYESPGFATAANRVDLRVESGVARVAIR
ncbi:MAG: DUF5668 domain-containing protein [Dehalococcoidia bacterium]